MDERTEGGMAETDERVMMRTGGGGCHRRGKTSTLLQQRENERKIERKRERCQKERQRGSGLKQYKTESKTL